MLLQPREQNAFGYARLKLINGFVSSIGCADAALEFGRQVTGGGRVAEPEVIKVRAAEAFDGDAAEMAAGFEEQDRAAHLAGLNGGGDAGRGSAIDADLRLLGLSGEGEEQLAAGYNFSAVTCARRLATPAV